MGGKLLTTGGWHIRFGALLLPERPDWVAEGFVPEFQDEKESRGWEAGTINSEGKRTTEIVGVDAGNDSVSLRSRYAPVVRAGRMPGQS